MGRWLGLLALLNVIVLLVGGGLMAMRSQPVPLMDFNADKVRLLGRVEKTAAPLPPAQATAAAPPPAVPLAVEIVEPRCLTWPALDQPLLEEIVGRMKKAGLSDIDYELTLEKPLGWWVFLPPLRDAVAVTNAMEAARRIGVKEMAPVRSGELIHAISLGVFPTLDKARTQKQRLAALGLKGMNAGPRPDSGKVSLVVSDQAPAASIAGLMEGWKHSPTLATCAAN